PVDPELTLAEAGVSDDGHIHIARCRRIVTTVNFKEESESHEFPPNVAIAAVYAWAAGPKGFKLSPTDKAEHMLVITYTETDADALGSRARGDARPHTVAARRSRGQPCLQPRLARRRATASALHPL